MSVLFWEVILMGGCVFAVSYCLHYLVYKNGMENESEYKKITKGEPKSALIDHSAVNIVTHPMLKKWLDFGGGYYGVVAFVRLLQIEFEQVKEFIQQWQGTKQFVDELGLGMLINFLVEQFINFAYAISWPAHYVRRFSIWECAILVGSTYLVYAFSKNRAKNKLAHAH